MPAEILKGRALNSAWKRLPFTTRLRLIGLLFAGRTVSDPGLAPLLIGAARLNSKLWWVPAGYVVLWLGPFAFLATRRDSLWWVVVAIGVVALLALVLGLLLRRQVRRSEDLSWRLLAQNNVR